MEDFEDILLAQESEPGFPLPFKQLQEKLDGLQMKESYLFTALEGVGKTEIIRSIEYFLLKNSTKNLGVIHLEESKERLLQGYAGYVLGKPCHIKGKPVPKEDVVEALKKVVKHDGHLNVYSHFGSDDPDVILSTIRYLVTVKECKYIFLDHITMVVSGMGKEEREALDYISTRLAMMMKELDFCLVYVSHVNDDGLTRGSRNISKIASVWVHLDRDLEAESEEKRNETRLIIKKNRPTGLTGPAGTLVFDNKTFMMSEKTSKIPTF